MRFPNAAVGVKRIYIGEVLALFASIAVGIGLILGFATTEGAANGDVAAIVDTAFNPLAWLVITTASIGGIALVVAGIINLIGVYNASKDEESFKAALYLIFIGIVASLLGSILSQNVFLSQIFSVASSVISLLTTLMIIAGISNLAMQLGNQAVQEKGQNIVKLIIITLAVSILIKLVLAIFRGSFGTAIAVVLAIFAVLLELAQLVIYLSFLSQTNKMLNS
ncbi:MAG: hypothetical protein IKQ97_04195 [Eubacterium sp.]|nr:hypothetical protein [Eubacterium sp.]